MENIFLDKFKSAIKDFDNHHELIEIINFPDSPKIEKFPFMKEILKSYINLKEAVQIIIKENNNGYLSLLHNLLRYCVNSFKDNYTSEIEDFLISDLLTLPDDRYEKLIGLVAIINLQNENVWLYRHQIITMLKNLDIDDTYKKYLMYEFLNTYLNYDLEESFKLIQTAKQKFPDEDLFYELEGHLAMRMLSQNLINLKSAENLLKNVYEWVIYRISLNLPEDNFNANFSIFLSTYAEILLSKNELEKAKEDLDTTLPIMEKVIAKEIEKYEDSSEEQKKLIYDIMKDYVGHYIHMLARYYMKAENISELSAFWTALEEVYEKSFYIYLTFPKFPIEELKEYYLIPEQ